MEYKKTAKSLVGRATISSNKNKTLVKKKKGEAWGAGQKCIYDLSSNLFCIGKQIIIGRNVVCDSVLDLSY